MRPPDDAELLTDYVKHNSEDAFTKLVKRHVALVYSAALRQVREPHLAEEVSQVVFIILARKARTLSHYVTLSGWLCRTAYFVSRDALRTERRRQHWELMATQMENSADTDWLRIAPLLDEVVAQLGDKDRSAIALRFYEQKPLNEVGAILGVDADTAQKRVSRALEKLRKFFARRGVSSTTAIIAGAIMANSVQAAPAALAKTASAAALAHGATVSGSTLTLIKGALKIMAWTKAKTAMVAGVVVLLAAGTTPVIIKEIRRHMDSRSVSGPRTTSATGGIKGQLLGPEQLVDAGNTTPEAAWETRYWARARGDYDAVIAGTDPQAVDSAMNWMGDKATFRDRSQSEFASLLGFQMLARKDLASNRVELKYQFGFENGSTRMQTKIVQMVAVNGAWRCAQTRAHDASWDDGSEPEPQP